MFCIVETVFQKSHTGPGFIGFTVHEVIGPFPTFEEARAHYFGTNTVAAKYMGEPGASMSLGNCEVTIVEMEHPTSPA